MRTCAISNHACKNVTNGSLRLTGSKSWKIAKGPLASRESGAPKTYSNQRLGGRGILRLIPFRTSRGGAGSGLKAKRAEPRLSLQHLDQKTRVDDFGCSLGIFAPRDRLCVILDISVEIFVRQTAHRHSMKMEAPLTHELALRATTVRGADRLGWRH